MEEYIKELQDFGIVYEEASENEKEMIKQYYRDGISSVLCAKLLVPGQD